MLPVPPITSMSIMSSSVSLVLSFLFFFFGSSGGFKRDSSSDLLMSKMNEYAHGHHKNFLLILYHYIIIFIHLLSILQISATDLKTTVEKLTVSLTVFILGSCRHRALCWGVKRRSASAWTPYLSSVQWVFSSQQFFFSHHSAWSDQSWGASATKHSTLAPPANLFIHLTV